MNNVGWVVGRVVCVSDDVAIGAYVEAKAYFLINHYSVLSCFQAVDGHG